MTYFKDQSNGLHFLSDEDIANGGLDLLPDGCAQISDEEADAIRAAAVAQAPAPALTKIYKSDIWRRCTDTEAVAVDALLKSQTIRLQRMWDDAQYLLTTDELYPLIYAGALQLFQKQRADQILEPTE